MTGAIARRLTPFYHSPRLNQLVEPPSGSSSEAHGGHHGQRLVAHASCGLGFPQAASRSSHQAARAKPRGDTSLFLNFGQRSLSLTHDNLFSVRGSVTILS